MPDTVDTLIGRIQAVVDVSTADALTELNWRHRSMVARAESLRKTVAVGDTVAGQADYPLSAVVAYSFEVNGVPYTLTRRGDAFSYSQGTLTFVDANGGGLIEVEADASGVQGIKITPTPTQSGLPITSFAAVSPDDLEAGGAASTIKVDPDFYGPLCDGVVATFLRAQGEGNPAELEQRFDNACSELRRRVNRRYRGTGPGQVRILGINV